MLLLWQPDNITHPTESLNLSRGCFNKHIYICCTWLVDSKIEIVIPLIIACQNFSRKTRNVICDLNKWTTYNIVTFLYNTEHMKHEAIL